MLIAIPVAAALKEILDFIYPPTDAPPREPTGAYKAMPDLKPDLKEIPPIISSDSPVSIEEDDSDKIDSETGAVEKLLKDG